LKLVFFGTPDFAVKSLEALVHSHHEVAGVVTQPDRPKGRGREVVPSPVKRLAQERGLSIFQPEKASLPEFVQTLHSLSPDLIVVAAYGEILKRDVLQAPVHGSINVHASLLPKYRGSSPIQAAIVAGDEATGVTIIQMDEQMDTGDILGQVEVPIGVNDTASTLHDKLAQVGARLLVETVDRIERGTVVRTPQDDEVATYTKRLRKEDGAIDWNVPAEKLHSFVRAMNPWPVAHTRGGKLRVWMTSVPSEQLETAEPGTVMRAEEDGLLVATLDGAVRIERIQVAGSRPMSAEEFLRGHELRAGEQLQ
jgi:methionyl-tRNA formyltransferase